MTELRTMMTILNPLNALMVHKEIRLLSLGVYPAKSMN
jgi:hypothetical protein